MSPEDVHRALKAHRAWIVERDRVRRDFRFDSFTEAMNFVNRVAAVAQTVNHHPNIRLHEWCYVELEVYSHDRGGLTTRDLALIEALDSMLAQA
jgi:4a-hydroxytetrahydrobiopterin dehydratase